MPFNLMVLLIEIGLKEVVAALVILTAVAAAAGFFYYNFRLQKNKVRDDNARGKADAAKEWREVADAHAVKIKDLEDQVSTCKLAHQNCEKTINEITQFNLRLQSRERGYQRTINRLEVKAGLVPTDFNDIRDAPSFSS